jgi:HEAT repeat protein
MVDPGPGPGRICMNWDVKSETATEVAATSVSMMAIKKFRQPLVEYLLSGLEDDNKWVRVMAAEMLGTIGDPRTAGHLKTLLADHDRDLRIVAARSLAMIRSVRATFPLSPVDNCEDCMIRLVADEALQRLKADKEIARHL